MDNIVKPPKPISERFALAVDAVRSSRNISTLALCNATGIDRRNLIRLLNNPAEHEPRPEWMAAICTTYGVSADYLLLARGNIFKKK